MSQFIEVTPLDSSEGETELINVDQIARVTFISIPNGEDVPIFAAQLFFKDGSEMKLRETYDRIARMIANEHRICRTSTLSPYPVMVADMTFYVDSSEKDNYSAPETRA
jgi:hypothetical protein